MTKFGIYKVLTNRRFILIFLFALIINLALQYKISCNSEMSFSEIRALYDEIRPLSADDKLECLNSKLESYGAFGSVDFTGSIDITAADYNTQDAQYDYIENMISEINTVYGYNDYIVSVRQNSQNMLGSSIFGDSLTGFSRKNIRIL